MTPFLQLLLLLSIIVAGAKAAGWLASWLHQPAVVGELLFGVLLGPSVLNLLGWPAFAGHGGSQSLTEMLTDLAELGVVCLMFLAGLGVDLHEMRSCGRVATLAGLSGVVVALVMGAWVALGFGFGLQSALFIGLMLTATSVSISAQALLELGQLRSRVGAALLGAAIIDDLLVILLVSFIVAFAAGKASPILVGTVLLKMVAYMGVAFALGLFVLPRLAEWIRRQPISEGLVALVFVTVLLFAWSAEVVGGLAAITGAFIAGVGFGRSRQRAEIEREMNTLTYAYLVPIFFVSIGLRTNVRTLAAADMAFALAMVVVAIVSKVIGCGLGARFGGFSLPEALRVGIGMISRGEVELIVASIGVSAGLIPPELLSVVTLIVLVTALVTPLLLRRAFTAKELRHA
jgi:Kef-type K+ transport system membrane component KefB